MAKRTKRSRSPSSRRRRGKPAGGAPARPHDRPPQGELPQPEPVPLAVSPSLNAAGSVGGEAPVRIRFYCQGIGDCHLLRFSRQGEPFWMLIDCGVHGSVSGGTATIRAIVDDVRTVTDRLDVVVLTHQHWDHNSGFLSAQEKSRRSASARSGRPGLRIPKIRKRRNSTSLRVPHSLPCRTLGTNSRKLKGRAAISVVSEMGLRRCSASISARKAKGCGRPATRSSRWVATASNISSRRTRPSSLPPTRATASLTFEVYVLGPPRDAAMLK